MSSYREGGQVRLGSVLLILSLAAAVLYPSRSAHAFENIEIGSSNTESINFAVYNTTPGTTPSTGHADLQQRWHADGRRQFSVTRSRECDDSPAK